MTALGAGTVSIAGAHVSSRCWGRHRTIGVAELARRGQPVHAGGPALAARASMPRADAVRGNGRPAEDQLALAIAIKVGDRHADLPRPRDLAKSQPKVFMAGLVVILSYLSTDSGTSVSATRRLPTLRRR